MSKEEILEKVIEKQGELNYLIDEYNKIKHLPYSLEHQYLLEQMKDFLHNTVNPAR